MTCYHRHHDIDGNWHEEHRIYFDSSYCAGNYSLWHTRYVQHFMHDRANAECCTYQRRNKHVRNEPKCNGVQAMQSHCHSNHLVKGTKWHANFAIYPEKRAEKCKSTYQSSNTTNFCHVIDFVFSNHFASPKGSNFAEMIALFNHYST